MFSSVYSQQAAANLLSRAEIVVQRLEFLCLHLDKTSIEQELTLCMDHVLRSDVHDYCILL